MKKERELTKTESAFEEAKSLFYVIILALSIRVLIFEPYYIPSASMKPGLIEGDYVFSTKYDYGYSRHSFVVSTNFFSGRLLASQPERGDIVIFRPPHWMETRYVKRLIGLPGDKIEFKNGEIYLNEKVLKRKIQETYKKNNKWYDEFRETLPSGFSYNVRYYSKNNLSIESLSQINKIDNMGPFFVPEGHYFFLGDNRHESGDSRFDLGYVPFENFISKVRFIFFSFSEPLFVDNIFSLEQVYQIPKWIASFRLNRFFGKINE